MVTFVILNLLILTNLFLSKGGGVEGGDFKNCLT